MISGFIKLKLYQLFVNKDINKSKKPKDYIYPKLINCVIQYIDLVVNETWNDNKLDYVHICNKGVTHQTNPCSK